MHKEWIEPALARHLDRVVAPEELWERIQRPRVRKARVPTSVNAARVGACATMLAVLLGVFLWQHGRIRTGDGGEMRAWVRAKAGIDVPLQARPVGVELIGARASRGFVEIAYRVRNHDGRLIVGGRHAASGGAKTFTWSMDGHTFLLECATQDDLKMACGLCHIG